MSSTIQHMLRRTTYTKTPTQSQVRDTVVIDANQQILGRLAVHIAQILQGKNKVNFVRNLDMGDIVIVTNSKKVEVTGKKMDNKEYLFYSGYPGGLRREKLRERMEKDPSEVIRAAVKGMLPKNKLRARMISRLFIFQDNSYEQKLVHIQKQHGGKENKDN